MIKLREARHSAISLWRAASVDADVRMRQIGHASGGVHANYTHFWDDALQRAADEAEKYASGDES